MVFIIVGARMLARNVASENDMTRKGHSRIDIDPIPSKSHDIYLLGRIQRNHGVAPFVLIHGQIEASVLIFCW